MDNTPRYFDGKSSRSIPATFAFQSDDVTLYDSEGLRLDRWPCDQLFVKEDWSKEIGAVFGNRHTPHASLAVFREEDFRNLQGRIQKISRKNTYVIPARGVVVFFLLVLSVISLFWVVPLFGQAVAGITYLIPRSVDAKLGNATFNAMSSLYPECNNNSARASLYKIADRLIKVTDAPNMKPDIHILRVSTPNAFSIPGRKIVVFDSFLKLAKNEDEIAGVLAHEIGHMIKRDAFKAYVKDQGLAISIGLITSSGSYGDVAKLATTLQGLDYSRAKEFDADTFGAETLIKAGYRTNGLSDFLEQMEKGYGIESRIEKLKPHQKTEKEKSREEWMARIKKSLFLLSTHPDTGERVERIRAMPNIAASKNSLSEQEFRALKSACQ